MFSTQNFFNTIYELSKVSTCTSVKSFKGKCSQLGYSATFFSVPLNFPLSSLKHHYFTLHKIVLHYSFLSLKVGLEIGHSVSSDSSDPEKRAITVLVIRSL